MRSGATTDQLGSALSYAAFLSMAHFHVSNEFRDWDTVHNTLTAANALHQALKRAPSVELLRGVFDVAMSIYLDRFLNMPPQRIPETGSDPVDGHSLRTQLLERMDIRQQVEEVSQLVSQHLTGCAEPEALLSTLGKLMLTEDADFHSFQIVDAGVQAVRGAPGDRSRASYPNWHGQIPGRPLTTPRAVGQTYQIALRLQRGEEIYREG